MVFLSLRMWYNKMLMYFVLKGDCVVKATETKLKGVYVLEPQVFGDARGWFMESWSKRKMEEAGIPTPGSTPAPTTPSCRQPPSFRPSRPVKASRSPASKRSPTAWAYITREQVHALAMPLKKNDYGKYLLSL